jgi:hypothetical protein
MGRRNSILNIQTIMRRRKHHLKKHRKRAEDKSVHLQHRQHNNRQTKEELRQKELGHKAELEPNQPQETEI